MRIKIKDNAWADILNIHYGASISLVFALTIIAQGVDKPGRFSLSIANDPISFCTFILLIVYMFADCITANARQGSHQENVIYMMSALLWIWFLGVCAIYAKSPETTKYLLIPAYFFLSRGFQVLAYSFNFFQVKPERKFAITLITVVALVFSILMIPTCASVLILGNRSYSGGETLSLNPDFIMAALSASLLILKVLEILWVAEPANSLQST